MFSKHKQSLVSASVIGSGFQLSGDCVFQGELQLSGHIAGQVLAAEGGMARLDVLEGGRIDGDVVVDYLRVAGTIVGPVEVREQLELLPTARIEGDVSYQILEMRPGAVVIGRLHPQFLPQAQASAATGEQTVQTDASETQAIEPHLDPEPEKIE